MSVQKQPRPPRKVGRKLMFESATHLRRCIDRYFESCWEEHWEEVKLKDGTIEWVQKFDRKGKPLMRLRQRPTVTGLALYLGTSRAVLLDYEQRDDYFQEVRRAKDMVEYYYENGAVEGTIHPSVAIFGLKNFGWTDKIEVTSHIDTQSLDIEEVREHIKRLRSKKKS